MLRVSSGSNLKSLVSLPETRTSATRKRYLTESRWPGSEKPTDNKKLKCVYPEAPLAKPPKLVLTHNDFTAELLLSVGAEYSPAASQDPDAVYGQWQVDNNEPTLLYVHCDSDFNPIKLYISWFEKCEIIKTLHYKLSKMRSSIFKSELAVIISALLEHQYADQKAKDMLHVAVYFHFKSEHSKLDRLICLGPIAVAKKVAKKIAKLNKIPHGEQLDYFNQEMEKLVSYAKEMWHQEGMQSASMIALLVKEVERIFDYHDLLG